MRVSGRPRLENAIIATGIPYRMVASHLDQYADMHRALQGACRSIRRMGSAALDLAYVGAGRTDAFVQVGLQPWDMAAGAVIVREAGGFVSDAAGGGPLHGARPPRGRESPDIQGPAETCPRPGGRVAGLRTPDAADQTVGVPSSPSLSGSVRSSFDMPIASSMLAAT